MIGGYGGKQSFNLPFVHRAIECAVRELPHLYFLFMNFDPSQTLPHQRIIYLRRRSTGKRRSVSFGPVMRCSMRDIGETFGLAVGEFSTGTNPC